MTFDITYPGDPDQYDYCATDDGTECDDRELCIQCRKPVDDEDEQGRFLHVECREDYADRMGERNWEVDCS